jgi:type IV secretory pathway VirB2 component (pilin)
MQKLENLPYPFLILIHVLLGVIIVTIPFTAKILIFIVMFYFIYRVLKDYDRNNEVLMACLYFVCAEVFFKMTKASPLHEIGKYFVLICLILGIFIKGFSLKSSIYIFYILLLIPSIFIASSSIDIDESLRKSIAFNLTGPVALGVAAIYCYNRKIKKETLLKFLGLGVAAITMMTVYIVFKAPSVSDISFSAASNATSSGGYGPNQVSTALGIGMFLSFARFLLIKKFSYNVIDLALFLLFAYRGYLTFSRGGVLTALLMIIIFIGTLVLFNRSSFRRSFVPKFVLIVGGVVLAFFYTSVVTDGVINNRYQNKSTLGKDKEDLTTGRGEISNLEIQAFLDNPIFGLGVGMGKYYRLEEAGIEIASHNEVTRLISEHGAVGVFSLLVLLIAPLFNRLGDKTNIFFYSFLFFWFATINHSAMRIAAPSLFYGLALLRFEQPTKKIKRKQEEEPDEFVEFMREKKMLPKRRILPELP